MNEKLFYWKIQTYLGSSRLSLKLKINLKNWIVDIVHKCQIWPIRFFISKYKNRHDLEEKILEASVTVEIVSLNY